MEFVDDLVLMAEDPGDKNVLLSDREKLFDEKGLQVNSTKCASLKVLPVKGKVAMKVITATHRYCKKQPVPSMDFEKLCKSSSPSSCI